ncbi:hypothetical protein HDU85_003039 [Gaertneriomyces sp. JEL0708]|nr:hypothetical protein HDU85_003039 [Gaertneriomyces sp. JEL0708]
MSVDSSENENESPGSDPSSFRSSAIPDVRPPTPDSEQGDVDEGYDEDFPDDFPFWYSGASGVQHMKPSSQTRDFTADHFEIANDDACTTEHRDRRHSYHDHDSVLHYFVATHKSENKLDRYLSGIIDAFLNEPAPVYASSTPDDMRDKFSGSEVPARRPSAGNMEEYLQTIKANVIDRATRVSAPKMIGHMTTALPYFHRPLARLLAAMNQNVVKLETASTITYLERQTIAMLHREFYRNNAEFYDNYIHSFQHSLGVFCSGGTVANITAMWTARNSALPADPDKDFAGVERAGLFRALKHYGYEGAVIIGSKLMHYSFKKAADLLGLGDEGLVTIDTDDAFRIRMDLLEETINQMQEQKKLIIAIVGIAGTTETGSIDPLKQIGLLCEHYKIHFHVDAAWGGPLIFSNEHRRKLDGIRKADTITVDGHKQLYTPMGLGLVLFQNPTSAHAIRKTANYVIRQDSPDLGRFTLEGSRPATSLHLHATLHLLGRDGLECLVTRSATLARQMSVRVDTHPSKAFQGLHIPQTNIFLFRYIPVALREQVHSGDDLTDEESDKISECTKKVQIALATAGLASRDGTDPESARPPPGFVSRTRVNFHGRDVDAFRAVIANPLTSWADIEDTLKDLLDCGASVENEMAAQAFLTRRASQIADSLPLPSGKLWLGWPFDL